MEASLAVQNQYTCEASATPQIVLPETPQTATALATEVKGRNEGPAAKWTAGRTIRIPVLGGVEVGAESSRATASPGPEPLDGINKCENAQERPQAESTDVPVRIPLNTASLVPTEDEKGPGSLESQTQSRRRSVRLGTGDELQLPRLGPSRGRTARKSRPCQSSNP